MTLHLPLASLLLLATSALPAQAASASYELDPVHTRVMVAVEHAGFSKALGTVSGSTGHLQFDPDDWTTAHLEVSVPLQRIDFGDGKWNQAVLAANLLDAATHPFAKFVSTRIEPIDPQHATVHGTLTLHGVSREVQLQVTLNALKRHPMPPFRRTAGFSAIAELSRADFGIDAWKSVIGDRVELRMEVEATRSRAGNADAEADAGEDRIDDDATQPVPTTEPATP
ncbi:polyisoprenoid-binding protein [Pseudoxanthomonas gei]|uniref:Polyisoprenoid-binding protein n=1 Tax=Pseudoxanthomonas gei TaxID=1383030 RepID=A0ABX0AIS3_9GAMM|nr:YceI family protein [Pseudoxanthomonas gei]NDK39128.1 polyisoprenoid-binding protein [Pseudoxanthomonas gei]